MSSVDENTEPRSTFRLRFSLLALFIFVTLVCLLLAWWVQPNRWVATASFRVSSRQPTILGDESGRPHDEHEFEVFKNTQLALLKSHFVLTAALRKPGVASLSTLQSQADPIEWLERHLEIEFPQDSEIMEISLGGTESQTSDLVRIVDAVATAYKDEVVYKDRLRNTTSRDMLARSLASLKDEIAKKTEEYAEILQEIGMPNDANNATLRQLNLSRLERVESQLMRLENEQLQLETSGEPGNTKFYEKRIAQLRERQAELEGKLTSAGGAAADLKARKQE